MSDGLSVANREERCANKIMDAAESLADALLDVRDAAFGYTSLTIEVVNDILRRAGVRAETIR